MSGHMSYHASETSGNFNYYCSVPHILAHSFSLPPSSLPPPPLLSLSVNKRDSRGVFLYVVSKYSDDFHMFFSSEAQCHRFEESQHTHTHTHTHTVLGRSSCLKTGSQISHIFH